MLKRVQEGKLLLNEVSKDTYNLVKDAWKDGTDKDKYEQWYVGNVGFLASYNGKWFDGGYEKPHIVKHLTVIKSVTTIKRVNAASKNRQVIYSILL